jgi:hypothetical protein
MEDETVVGTEETLDTQEVVEEAQEESVEDIKARLAKAEELAKNYKIRAEKAESRPKEEAPNLSMADILAVTKAGIEPEDLDEAVEYAKFKGISLHEALKSSVMKATLAEKAELRKSADATNTGTVRRASTQVSDERLLADAQKGDLPDSDADLKRLIALQMKSRRS